VGVLAPSTVVVAEVVEDEEMLEVSVAVIVIVVVSVDAFVGSGDPMAI
jgi:hypothetical protein